MHKKNVLSKKRDRLITFEDLSKQQMILSDKKQIIPNFVNLCKSFGIKSDIEFENGDWETAKNFVKLNLGICLFSNIYDYFPQFKDKDIVSKNVEHLFPAIPVNLITKTGIIYDKTIQNFIDITNQEYLDDK
jgi:hypothetical protein